MNRKQLITLYSWSQDFLRLMYNRTLHGGFKHGTALESVERGNNFGAMIGPRLEAYLETGNLEYLSDIANFSMYEFMWPSHPKAHFQAADSEKTGQIGPRV